MMARVRQAIGNGVVSQWRTALLLILLLRPAMGMAAASPDSVLPEEVTETQVKAAFLFNFAKFVAWPPTSFASPASPISICVIGQASFVSTLEDIVKNRAINGRKLAVKRVQPNADLRSCHLLFVASSYKRHFPGILQALRSESVLTVGETEAFLRTGGIINFVIQDGRVRFEIDPGAAARAGLHISSTLLSLAKIVRGPALREGADPNFRRLRPR